MDSINNYIVPTNKVEEMLIQGSLELQKAQYLDEWRNTKKLQLDQMRERNREASRERRKAQYEMVYIDSNGSLCVRTENLMIPAYSRKLANFQYPEIIELRNLKTMEQNYRIECTIDDRKVQIWVSGSKCGDGKYMLKKFNTVGCEIYAPTLRKQMDYVIKLWTKLRSDCHQYAYIPERIGWQTNENGLYIFVKEGALLWNDICKMIR